MLRAVLATSPGPAGWLAALADPQVGAALAAIHSDPGRHWTVAGLARVAAMSRSAFAARFRELAGMPPLEYLITWRMHRAAHQLRTTTDSAATIGAAVGYPAETTFSTTFKRVIGQPPGRYRTAVRSASTEAAAGQARLALAKAPRKLVPRLLRCYMRREELCVADLIDNARAVQEYLADVERSRWDGDPVLRDAVLDGNAGPRPCLRLYPRSEPGR